MWVFYMWTFMTNRYCSEEQSINVKFQVKVREDLMKSSKNL